MLFLCHFVWDKADIVDKHWIFIMKTFLLLTAAVIMIHQHFAAVILKWMQRKNRGAGHHHLQRNSTQ